MISQCACVRACVCVYREGEFLLSSWVTEFARAPLQPLRTLFPPVATGILVCVSLPAAFRDRAENGKTVRKGGVEAGRVKMNGKGRAWWGKEGGGKVILFDDATVGFA